jgi:limonene-1,2-epoxide hydrolase
MAKRDPESLRPYLAEGAVYHNVGLPASVGREAILTNLAAQFAIYPDSYQYVVKNLASNGGIVLTERLDMIRTNFGVIGVPVMGTFVVDHGLITNWRDYWDTALPTRMRAGEDVTNLVPSAY